MDVIVQKICLYQMVFVFQRVNVRVIIMVKNMLTEFLFQCLNAKHGIINFFFFSYKLLYNQASYDLKINIALRQIFFEIIIFIAVMEKLRKAKLNKKNRLWNYYAIIEYSIHIKALIHLFLFKYVQWWSMEM